MAKKIKKEIPQINKELEGFSIDINEFGEIITNYKIDKLNDFLNENVEDRKLEEGKKNTK
ncbi:MAG: hypothetical protein IPH74_10560 [Bacteroidetes bacterium]|jgi:hypothetical protein|nr:hypothetical protein [Bacteroidota bacterium]MBP7256373.1 hypothetical protein [Chitinophagales bacterium]MBK7139435.1 hypothetical protein [Bacteroidota bacterium]MBK7639207.1 hypothetical protein [Bacteroidota bacterium]MBK8672999.1 hypothetical protein [Bacteroidota bacterium]